MNKKYQGRYKEYQRKYHQEHKQDPSYKARRYKTARKYIKGNLDKVKIYHKQYWNKWYLQHKNNPEYKIKKNENHKHYSKKHPERIYAKNAIHNKLRFSGWKRLPCSICGKSPSEMHHPDYNQPLLIIHLCRNCHNKLHRM